MFHILCYIEKLKSFTFIAIYVSSLQIKPPSKKLTYKLLIIDKKQFIVRNFCKIFLCLWDMGSRTNLISKLLLVYDEDFESLFDKNALNITIGL